jgi:hypothetical protein
MFWTLCSVILILAFFTRAGEFAAKNADMTAL